MFVIFQATEHVHDDDADESGSPISSGWRSLPNHTRNRENCKIQGTEGVFDRLIDFYRPPMKLREGNVFTGVCQSVWGWE